MDHKEEFYRMCDLQALSNLLADMARQGATAYSLSRHLGMTQLVVEGDYLCGEMVVDLPQLLIDFGRKMGECYTAILEMVRTAALDNLDAMSREERSKEGERRPRA